MPKHIDLSGQKLGKLTVLSKIRRNGFYYWNCKCDCGNEVSVIAGALNRKEGPTRSCGCLVKDVARKGENNGNYRHGHAQNKKRTKALSIWTSMMQRCYNENETSYRHYGLRGIGVCDRWHSFENFLDDMGIPLPNQSIDRIDNDLGYSPENCRWATDLEQVRNRRVNIYRTIDGETKTLSEWAELYGVNYFTLYSRVKKLGWGIEAALRTPFNGRKCSYATRTAK